MSRIGTYLKILLSFFCFCCRAGHGRGRPRQQVQTCAPTGDWEFQISDFGFRIYLRWTPLCSGSDFGPNGHRERISNCRPRNSWLPCRSGPLSSTNWPNKFSSNLLGLLSHTDIMAQGLVLRWTGTDEDVRANRWMGTGMDKEVPANRSILYWNHQTPFTYSHIYTFSHLHSWTPKPAEFLEPDFQFLNRLIFCNISADYAS